MVKVRVSNMVWFTSLGQGDFPGGRESGYLLLPCSSYI